MSDLSLYINTALFDRIILKIIDSDKVIHQKTISAPRKQAEKLLLGIIKLLNKSNISLKDLKSIRVVNRGGSFTSLRIGVVTANALAYALDIPVREDGKKGIGNKKNVIKPIYDREPSIGKSKKQYF